MGWAPELFETAEEIREVGAGISLAPNGMRVLESLGLAAHLKKEVGERIVRMWAARPDGSTIADFPTKAEDKFDQPMIGFRRARLRQVLLDEVSRKGLKLHLGKRLRAIDQPLSEEGGGAALGPASLTFEDGSCFEADLVVGCDGLRSRTRQVLFGEQSPRYLGEEVVFAVSSGRHLDLVPEGTCVMVYGRGKHHFGCYGLAKDCLGWFTVSRVPEAKESWGMIAPASVPGEQEALLREFEGWKLPQALISRPASVMIKLGMFDRDPATTWTRGTATLAGDAANPIPANLGQGGNKALEDVAVLAECMARAARPGAAAGPTGGGGGRAGLYRQLQGALSLYERVRLQRAAALLSYSRQAGQVANADTALTVAARDLSVKLLVALYGTLPSDWMWKYDCREAVEAALRA